MSKDLNDALDFAAKHTPSRSDTPTEIQHPTDLLGTYPYYELMWLLFRLKVVPSDIMMMTSSYWGDWS